MSLSQIELVWVRVRVEGECFWVNLREENKVSEFHNAQAESKMAEFRWQNSRWLPSSSWVRKMNEVFLSNEWGGRVWVKFFLWQDNKVSESKMAVSESNMAEFKMAAIIKWEWMSLSQNELVWVRVRVEGECFWVNLRQDNKVSEFQDGKLNPMMAEFKMAAIIKLSENEWVWVRMN